MTLREDILRLDINCKAIFLIAPKRKQEKLHQNFGTKPRLFFLNLQHFITNIILHFFLIPHLCFFRFITIHFLLHYSLGIPSLWVHPDRFMLCANKENSWGGQIGVNEKRDYAVMVYWKSTADADAPMNELMGKYLL